MTYKSKKPIICLLLIACVGMIAVPVLAEPNFGFEYATALNLGTRDLRATVMQVVNILLGFLGIVLIGIVLYGGYLYMTSGGSADKIEKAKKILINGAIGLAIILASYAIAFFIIRALTNATGGDGGCNKNGICEAGETCSNCPGDCGVCPPPFPPIGQNFAVSWVDPKKAETDVSLCRLIQIKFNNQIDPYTINNLYNGNGVWSGSFVIEAIIAKTDVNLWVEIDGKLSAESDCEKNNQCASGVCDSVCLGDLVPGKITMWSDARGLTFNNSNDFEIDTTYKITIKSNALATSGLENINGNRLTSGDYTWTFTTGQTTDVIPPTVLEVFPEDDAIDVCRASAVEAKFSEPMDISSLLSTDVGSPMDANSDNSIYINPNISGFDKSVPDSNTLIANPKELYTANANYTPVLDSDVIRDSCGNYLDGDGDGVSKFSASGDDYAPLPVGANPDWSFTTGNIEKCVPEIISIIPSTGYYNDESAQNADLLTINGNYFTMAGILIFNNNVEVSSAVNSCIDPTFDANYIPNQKCLTSWSDHTIEVRVPAQGGVSNGAISGNVAVEVGVNSSNVIQFTVASPRIDSVLPKEGGIDQFVTISGTGFGAAKGENDHVYFRRDEDGDGKVKIDTPAELVEANYPCAGNVGWTDKQIIISIPDNVSFADDEDWYIQIVRDQATNKYWGNLGDFKFKDIEPGPGLCSITNIESESDYYNSAEAVLDDTFQLSGVRFAGEERKVYFGNYKNPVLAKQIVNWIDNSSPNKVDADTPNIADGTVNVYIEVDGQNSNTLNFIIHPTDAGPKINYFDPSDGAVGEYVTIYGNGFGSWDGGVNSNVQFANGAGEWINGNFDFPQSCGNNFWSDTQIIVKVPAGAATGNIKITTRDSLTDDTSDLSPSNFTVTAGPAGPGICNIQPKAGPIGISVDIFGERFTGADEIIFFNNKKSLNFNFIDDEKASAVVPSKNTSDVNDDAVSGPIIIVDDKNGDTNYNDGSGNNDIGEVSNGYNFNVFDCRESANGCVAIGYPSYECCYDGSCMDQCNNPTQATYAWNFSTGTYTTCGGYGANQCLASKNCPNSPGRCSSSPAQTGVDTGSDCGTAYCNAKFPVDCAGGCSFSNNRCVSATACDITKDVNKIIAGLSGVARCNNVSGKNYWQTDVPCQSGTYLDINGKCTLGSANVPKSCIPNCADGFSCMDMGEASGACVKQNICPSGSTCDVANIESNDNYNACKKNLPSKCECCCRVSHSDTDCCVGLTCVDDTCGVDNTEDKYGYCKGCAVWDLGNFFQNLSDDKCGCQNSNRICIVDEQLVSPARDTGSCGDCANINDIDFDSNGDGTVGQVKDIEHECRTHSGSCCWNSISNACYTCDALEVIEESCPPSAMSSPSPQKNKTDVCLNFAIYLKFNLELNPQTLGNGFRIYKCTAGDRNCTSTSFVTGNLTLTGSKNELIFTPDNNILTPNNILPDTWHKVIINQTLKDLNGLSLSSNYEWFFKTNNEAELCAIDTINITPKDEIITKVNDTRSYNALPVGDCTVLNPASYNWSWQSSDTSIATITNNDTALPTNKIDPNQIATALDKDGSTKIIAKIPTELKEGEATLFVLLDSPKVIGYWPNCEEACLNASVGAKFNMAMDTTTLTALNIKLYKWRCGNGEVEIGEDCDDGGVKNGDGCSANCLNEGSNGTTSICGNGTIELGEECDGNPLPQGCNMTKCTHIGSVVNLSICGDKKIAEGEDCDDGGVANNDGCDATCLNEGTNEFASEIALNTISFAPADNTIDINLPVGTYFQPNTYYRVFFSNNIKGNLGQKQLTDLNWDFNKDNTNDSFSWSFKTKDNFCSPDVVKVSPEQKVIYNINATQDYEASIYSFPDNCDPNGQKLNSYAYNWSWMSTAPQIADFITPFPANRWPSCGNEKIEKGEDCDDGNAISGDGCSSVCINEGTTRDMELVSHWEFNEGSDVLAHDSAGVNDGSLVDGPVWTTGKFGGALEFDGVDDYVNINNVLGQPNLDQEWTVSAWVNITDRGDTQFLIHDMNIGVELVHTNFNKLLLYLNSGVNNYYVYSDQAGLLAGKGWKHVAFVFRNSDGYRKIYVDGVDHTGPGSNFTSTPLGLADSWHIGKLADGLIDDVRIYKKALTGAQIQGIMNQKNDLCGNGIIDFGEDCDGSSFPDGCDLNTCLHTGSLGVCGNGIIETGEDCDDHNTTINDGCSSVCLNEGTETDSYIDFYQTATTKSPGKTNIEASVNYCDDAPTATCGGTLPACSTGSCKQTTGSSELEVVCDFSGDDSCYQGVCASGFCTNNPNVACTPANETVNCNLTAIANTTCNFQESSHICPITTWGGECSTSKKLCYSQNDCSDAESCQPHTDCNYCKNNTSFECRVANGTSTSNYDCQLGVGYDSCCYSRPIIKSKSPDSSFFNSSVINCDNNFCSAFNEGTAVCQTYTCQENSCSAYGKCKITNNNNPAFGSYCLNNNDCPSDSICDKSCANNSDCNDIVCGACRNAQINITFDKLMDPFSFTSGGVCSNNSSKSCDQDSNCPDSICLKNIRLSVKYDDAAINQKNCPTGYYAENNLVYQKPETFIAKLFIKIKILFNKLFGRKETIAAEYWCAIPGTITSFDSNNRTTAIFAPQGLTDNLFEDGVTYRVTVKRNVKSIEGVSMGKDDSGDFQYEFTAGDTECQVESVDVYVGN